MIRFLQSYGDLKIVDLVFFDEKPCHILLTIIALAANFSGSEFVLTWFQIFVTTQWLNWQFSNSNNFTKKQSQLNCQLQLETRWSVPMSWKKIISQKRLIRSKFVRKKNRKDLKKFVIFFRNGNQNLTLSISHFNFEQVSVRDKVSLIKSSNY